MQKSYCSVLEDRFARKHGAALETFPGRLCAACLLETDNASITLLVTRRLCLERRADVCAVIEAPLAERVKCRVRLAQQKALASV